MAGEAVLGRALLGAGARAAARGPLAALGPLGWVAIGALTLYDGYQLYNAMSESLTRSLKNVQKVAKSRSRTIQMIFWRTGGRKQAIPRPRRRDGVHSVTPKLEKNWYLTKGNPDNPDGKARTIITVQTQTARAVTMSTWT